MFGEYLVKKGLICDSQLSDALAEQLRSEGSILLGHALLKRKAASIQDLSRALDEYGQEMAAVARESDAIESPVEVLCDLLGRAEREDLRLKLARFPGSHRECLHCLQAAQALAKTAEASLTARVLGLMVSALDFDPCPNTVPLTEEVRSSLLEGMEVVDALMESVSDAGAEKNWWTDRVHRIQFLKACGLLMAAEASVTAAKRGLGA